MNKKALLDLWQQEEQKPFAGWDFAYLDGKMQVEQPPWSYIERAAELMQRCSSVLDMGTGGGEVLLQLKKNWPPVVAATESYPPNQILARQQLTPWGVKVVDVMGEADLPFTDNEFELIVNRHAGFSAGAIARVLAPGGIFFTQQVHGLSSLDLLACFDVKPMYPEAIPEVYVPRLKAAGLIVSDVRNWSGRMSFTNVGAMVYYLKVAPWVVEGFSVETHFVYLLALQRRLEQGAALTFETRRYLIEAHK